MELGRDDDLVRALLAPLERVQPVTLPKARRRSRRGLVLALAAGLALFVVGGLALAGAFGPLHGATLKPSPSTIPLTAGGRLLTCELIGLPASRAQTILNSHGLTIEWRFQHWGADSVGTGAGTTPGAISGGYTTAPASVPPDSIVWDLTRDERTPAAIFVFVQAPNDPNTPTIVRPSCPNGGGQP